MSKITWPQIFFVCLACSIFVGCAYFIDRFTPADKSNKVLRYAGEDPNKVDFPFGALGMISLHKARRLQETVEEKHYNTQLDYVRKSEDDNYAYQSAFAFNSRAIKTAEEVQKTSIAIASAIFGGSLGGIFVKRKGDSTPDEVQAKLADVANKTWDECEKYLADKGLLKTNAISTPPVV